MILVYAEAQNGEFKKATLEAICYGYQLARQKGVDCGAIVLGNVQDTSALVQYGASKVFTVQDPKLEVMDSQVYAAAIGEIAKEVGASVILLPNSSTTKAIIGRVAVRLDAQVISNVNNFPEIQGDTLHVNCDIFSGKAQVSYALNGDVSILSLNKHTVGIQENPVDAEHQSLQPELPDPRVQLLERKTLGEGVVPLPEAELVVSAGRGMKGPENWGIVEELAEAMGATTACSRPVADTGWRPHHEHVGQTGVAIRPQLYIAIGISGAIQHLAGVNGSDTIVVINKDPEAPFFKAADYGICGDLFDVVPRLTEAIKKAKDQ